MAVSFTTFGSFIYLQPIFIYTYSNSTNGEKFNDNFEYDVILLLNQNQNDKNLVKKIEKYKTSWYRNIDAI